MNSKMFVLVTIAFTLIFANLSSIYSAMLYAGKYKAPLYPSLDTETAKTVMETAMKFSELKSIEIDKDGTTLSFTVKENIKFDEDRLGFAVRSVAPGVTIGLAALEGSTPYH